MTRALRLQRHRGPDGSGWRASGACALGASQLCFHGQGAAAQPLSNEDSNIWLVCNGEIFNDSELRRRLGARHRFAGTSDCEVILHLYEEMGADVAEPLDGQYAFVLWDSLRRWLIVARDRFGICPLFLRRGAREWMLASELKALVLGAPDARLDLRGIAEAAAMYGPLAPRTCFEGVEQILPGQTAVIEIGASGPRVTSTRTRVQADGANPAATTAGVLSAVERAVRRRVSTESPPGLYLSGGVDSALIAAMTVRTTPQVTAFSLAFERSAFDESRWQREVVRALRLDHQTVPVADADLARSVARAVWHAECPLTRAAPAAMLLLSSAVRAAGHKHVLTGEGADELFAGYPVFGTGRPSVAAKHELGRSLMRLLAPGAHQDIGVDEEMWPVERPPGLLTLRCAQDEEIRTKLSGYLLATQGDRMAMAHGVEPRFPYLDSEVVALARRLPLEALWDGNGKVALRRAASMLLPSEIAERPKQGFLAPDAALLESWRADRSRWQLLLSPGAIATSACFDPRRVAAVLERALTSSGAANPFVQAAFVFVLTTQMLHAMFVEGDREAIGRTVG